MTLEEKRERREQREMVSAKKETAFCLSKWLPKDEAVQLARSMRTGDKWYIYKIGENPKAKHIADRESFVVVRKAHKGELINHRDGVQIKTSKLESICTDLP